MRSNLCLGFVFGVGLLGILGCAAPPSEQGEESPTANEEKSEAADDSVIYTDDFESGQAAADSESPADEIPEEKQSPDTSD